jgi:hypothetical protein
VVAWVEANGEQRGDLVVVQPTTGAVLARTPIPGPPDRPVRIAGVDDDTVYFATPVTSWDGGASPLDVWSWRWAIGQPPQPSQDRIGGGQIMDVSGGVWAVSNRTVLKFRDATGAVVSEVPTSYADRNYFGDGLSPDGRYWYSSAYNEFVVTATGERVPAPAGLPGEDFLSARHGWAGPTRLTVIALGDGGLALCDASTGTCTDHVTIPEGSHYDLPAY